MSSIKLSYKNKKKKINLLIVNIFIDFLWEGNFSLRRVNTITRAGLNGHCCYSCSQPASYNLSQKKIFLFCSFHDLKKKIFQHFGHANIHALLTLPACDCDLSISCMFWGIIYFYQISSPTYIPLPVDAECVPTFVTTQGCVPTIVTGILVCRIQMDHKT